MDMHEDFSSLEQLTIRRAKAGRHPVNGSLELTPVCNMNCAMCYVRMSPEEARRKGGLRPLSEWLRIAEEMARSGVLFLLLTGGEPLTYPGFRELYLRLKALGFILTINTNGTLIDEEWADFFAAHKPRRINITLYGSSDETYQRLCRHPNGFQRTVRAIELLRQRRIDVKISTSVTPANRADLLAIHQLGPKLDVPVHADTYMMPADRERDLPFDRQSRLSPEDAAQARLDAIRAEFPPDMFRQYAAQTLAAANTPVQPPYDYGVSCLAGNCSFTINWQGEMRPCVVFPGVSASVTELGFAAAWRKIVADTAAIRISNTCAACPKRTVCRTCAAAAYLETGAYDGVPDYLCRYADEYLRLLQAESAAP